MKNIELFDDHTARILADLYVSFPVKRRLDARKLSGHEAHDDFGRILDERGNPSKTFEIAHATIEWLWDTGYVRGDRMDQYGLGQAVLTPIGLAVLKATPTSLTPGESTGEKLARLVREGAMDGARELVKAALVTGTAMGIGAVGG